MSKIVIGAAVVLNIGGESRYLYRGAPVPTGADREDVARLVELNLIGEADTPEGEQAVDTALDKPSTAWTVEQLRTFAETKQIDLGKARSKADLVKAIEEGKPLADSTVVVVQTPANPSTPGEAPVVEPAPELDDDGNPVTAASGTE